MSRQTLILAVKALVSIALVAFLLHRVEFGPLLRRFEHMQLSWLGFAIAVFIGQLLLTGWRYALIGRAIDAALPTIEAIRLVLIGQFFSQTLPSAVGGDAVRAYMTTRHGIRWGRAVSAVLCDRGVAMVVLMVLSSATIPIFLARIADPLARLFTPVPALVVAIGLAALILGNDTRLMRIGRWRIAKPFCVLVADLRRIVFASPESRTIIPLSILVHLGVIASVWLLGRALRLDIAFLDCLVLVPPIVVATLVPVSIAGWGIREAAMIYGFGLVGFAEADALALSVATGLAQIVAGVPGGVLWLLRGRPGPGLTSAGAAARPD